MTRKKIKCFYFLLRLYFLNINKIKKKKRISTEKALEFCNSKNMLFQEASAKTADQVNTAFL